MNRRPNHSLTGKLLAGAGALFLLISVFVFQPLLTAVTTGQGYAVGKVVELNYGTSETMFRVCALSAEYEVNGVRYVTDRAESESPCFQKNRRDIGIIYDVKNPANARVDSSFNSGKTLLIGGAGLLLMGSATWLATRGKSTRGTRPRR